MSGQNFTMYSGDSKTLSVRVVNENWKPVDIDSATDITYKLAASVSGTALITKDLSDGISVANSTVTITLGTADTASLSGDYYHELQITDASSNVFTAFSGTVTVTSDLI